MTNPVSRSGDLAIEMADLAREAIGPEGTVYRLPEDDAQLARAAFISKIAEAAVKLANGESP